MPLPAVTVAFSTDRRECRYGDGIYRGGIQPTVTVCADDDGSLASELWRRRTLIHELAHAWDSAFLDDERRVGLMAVLGVDVWLADDERWKDLGAERLAETIAWGLDDQLHRPVLIDATCDELRANFRAIAGRDPLGPIEPGCTPGSSSAHRSGEGPHDRRTRCIDLTRVRDVTSRGLGSRGSL